MLSALKRFFVASPPSDLSIQTVASDCSWPLSGIILGLAAAKRWTIAVLCRRLERRGDTGALCPNHSLSFLEAKALVVDDEPEARGLLVDYLEGEGYTVATAASGEEALEAVRRDAPHVVLLDIRMPGMNGLEVLRRLHRDHPEIPVVMLTDIDDDVLARSTLRIGASECVKKSFTPDQVGRAVLAAVRKVSDSPQCESS